MKKLNIVHHSGNYDCLIKQHLLDEVELHLNLNRKVLVVTDNGVPKAYYEKVLSKALKPFLFIFEQGEQSKNITTLTNILTKLTECEFTRTDCVIAVGGGVCGDMAGLAASLYMRGICFYNIPTTLLSQVDSSIGGKTAIDYLGYKNIIGSFYQPSKVLVDPSTLHTLEKRQIHAGLVEAFKMGLCFDQNLCNKIMSSPTLDDDLEDIIYDSLKIKRHVVEVDTKEKGLRKVLNFGHTFGHAIESLGNGQFLHGEAVGIGMLYVTSKEVHEMIKSFLNKYELPSSCNFSKEQLVSLIKHDKKMSSDICTLVKCEEVGTYKLEEININNI